MTKTATFPVVNAHYTRSLRRMDMCHGLD